MAFGAFVGAASGLLSGVSNAMSAARNVEFQRAENETTRSREDTAYQRAVADARAAGLSPLVVSGTSGASSQALTAPQMETDIAGRAISSGSQVFQDILNSRSVDGQLALNNAQVAKLAEETRGQSISNAYASADYEARILKLLDEAENIKANTAREKVFLEEYRKRLQEELKGLELGNSGKSIANQAAQGTLDFNNDLDLPAGTTWSGSTGNPIDSARISTRSLKLSYDRAAANSKAVEEQLRKDYGVYTSNSEKAYQTALDDWKEKMKVARDKAKKSNSAQDAQAFKSLQKSKPRRSDFVLSFDDYKKQRLK